jgi:hypothetical protein
MNNYDSWSSKKLIKKQTTLEKQYWKEETKSEGEWTDKLDSIAKTSAEIDKILESRRVS